MKIIYCGHSAVVVETARGTRIAIDPFLDGNPLCPKQLRDPGPLNYICLTHGHADHVGSTVELVKRYNATVFATFELAMLLQQDGVPEALLQPMNKGGSVALPTEGVRFSLTQAFHSSSYQAKDGSRYYAGEAAGVVVQVEGGPAIYHAGDTLLFSDMRLIGECFRPTVALLPIGDRFTMGPGDAAEAAKLVGAPKVIPIHYKTFPQLSGTAEEFAALLNETDIEPLVLQPGETCSV
ncbi:MAG: metal-dependent hydrolase [Bdellovibrionales bacterium]|nr:metal-dependent hydrolase [Bdellovibrionales bacterium]